MTEPTPPPLPPTDLHVCVGLNSCKGQDITRTATMAGTGNCATVQHMCHGNNACRGQGGCGYLGTPAEQGLPGENACRQFGSCAVPINKNRVSSEGQNKGKSVWRLARARFEQRMYDIGKPFGPAPAPGVADDIVPGWYEGSNCGGGGCSNCSASGPYIPTPPSADASELDA